jgi:Uncharacterized conserved protein
MALAAHKRVAAKDIGELDRPSPESRMPAKESHHHLCGHRRDPYADHVAASAHHPDEITREALPRPRRAPRSCISMPAIPRPGSRTRPPEAFGRFLPRIKQGTNAVINITSGGSPYMKVEERILPAAVFKPEVASLNMGSINFGLFPLLEKYKDFKFEWERQHLENTRDLVFRNTFRDIEYILTTLSGNGTRFEFECYDIAHLYNLRHFLDRGLVKPPLFIQSVFGILGGIGTHPEDLMHMKRTADRLFEDSYQWSILGAGRNQIALATIGASMGANVRVGLEDSLWAGPGKLAKSNADQVRIIRQVLEGLSLEVATPDEAREILQLKGGDQVAF